MLFSTLSLPPWQERLSKLMDTTLGIHSKVSLLKENSEATRTFTPLTI